MENSKHHTELPEIKIIAVNTVPISQSIDNVIIETYVTDDTTKVFNEAIRNTPLNSILIFLSEYDNFTDEHSVKCIVEAFQNNPHANIIYTDCIIKAVYTTIMYYQAFHPDIIMLSNKLINTPLAIRKTKDVLFNENLKHLYYHKFLKDNASPNFNPLHIAMPLFTSKSRPISDIKTEFQQCQMPNET